MSTTLSLATRARKSVATASRSSQLACIATAATFIVVLGGLLCLWGPTAAAQSIPHPKLVGTGAVGAAAQGASVALSGDGSTAIVGGSSDNSSVGAAWVFTRSTGVWTQQGSKLVGTGAVGQSSQGNAVALSADGNTAMIGGPFDNGEAGAVWVFTRSGGVWTQQGSKLVGTGAVGTAIQGDSVALSADGNTALVGGWDDNSSAGAAWVFTRSGGVWTQQGSKLVGTGAVGNAQQGWSVALSADGNTAMIGGPEDNSNVGAAWIFTRSGGVWTQQGSKLVGTGAVGSPFQGMSVALSGDGNTAMIGGPDDNGDAGAVWVFTQSGGVWTQQGSKLVGTGAVGNADQGSSVALSANGSLALVGGPEDGSTGLFPGGPGAAWLFIDSGGVWIQQGSKLVGSGAVGNAAFGYSVALVASGTIALVGGPADNNGVGAAWPFGGRVAHDFNADGVSDILWRDTSGDVAVWAMAGSQILLTAGFGAVPTTWSVVGQRDFVGNGNADIFWRDTNGDLAMWLFMNGLEVAPALGNLGSVTPNWSIYGTGDLNGDGIGDILWRDTVGDVAISFMNDAQVSSTVVLGQVSTSWTIVGDDSHGDIFWHDASGNYVVWRMNGTQVVQTAFLGNVPLATWQIAGLGDFNGDGITDVLWRDTAGDVVIWFLNSSLAVQSTASLGNIPTTWTVAQTGDYNGDGYTDILWVDTSGDVVIWFMSGGTVLSSAGFGSVGTSWTAQSLNAE